MIKVKAIHGESRTLFLFLKLLIWRSLDILNAGVMMVFKKLNIKARIILLWRLRPLLRVGWIQVHGGRMLNRKMLHRHGIEHPTVRPWIVHIGDRIGVLKLSSVDRRSCRE